MHRDSGPFLERYYSVTSLRSSEPLRSPIRAATYAESVIGHLTALPPHRRLHDVAEAAAITPSMY
jgi:hypothetical protein